MIYVEIKELSKRFDERTVLENVSFEIRKGEILGLIGPNGAGKTTLINILLGLLRPDKGTVSFDGQQMDEAEMEIKSKIGFIPQEIALIDDTSCWNNLLYFASLYNLSGKNRQEACSAALALIGLEAEKNKKVSKLSGGMKRRLNIACATMHKPEMLILDEPTVGIDPQSRNYIFEYLLDLNRHHGCTILYTSHYMEEVDRLCDRIFILDEGREIAYGDKDSIRALVESGRQVEFITEMDLDDHSLAALAAIEGVKEVQREQNVLTLEISPTIFSLNRAIRVLEEESVTLLQVSYKQISLEQVFLELTGKDLRE